MDMTNYYIHPSYRKAEILDYIEYLVTCECPENFDDVSLSDKYKLATLLSIVDGRTDELSFLTESNDASAIMCLFRKYVARPSSESSADFLEALKEAFIDHYHSIMKKLFDSAMEDHKSTVKANVDHVHKYGDEDTAYDNYRSNNL